MIFGQGLIEIHKTFGKLNLQEIEKMLRQTNSRTFLIGLNIEGMDQFDAKLIGTDRYFPYYLWTEVNWEQAALRKLVEEGITPDQNFERLSETGMLVLRKGTQISRALNAPLN